MSARLQRDHGDGESLQAGEPLRLYRKGVETVCGSRESVTGCWGRSWRAATCGGCPMAATRAPERQ